MAEMNTRILGRRLPLNKGETSWLDIGIAVVPEPHVEIALIDARQNVITLTEETWEKLLDQRSCILSYLLHHPSQIPNNIGLNDVTAKFGTVEGKGTISFNVPNTEIVLMLETCQTMMRYDGIVRPLTQALKTIMPMVKSQLAAFVDAVKRKGNSSFAYETIVASPRYQKFSQIDNELASLALGGIIKLAATDFIISIEESLDLNLNSTS